MVSKRKSRAEGALNPRPRTFPRRCYYIPIDSYVEGRGYRVSIVVEGEGGHVPTGTWPYEGKVGQQAPWFWGHDYKVACKLAEEQNSKLGLSKEDVFDIVTSSMMSEMAREASDEA